jgi:regulator of protease activity HflC (stomatin/prohibitin superfamily)
MADETNNIDPVEPRPDEILPTDESPFTETRLTDDLGDQDFDAANKSLASALRISFVALQLVMVVLIGVYIFSGWRNVPEQDRGLRLLFGGIQDQQALEAGGYFTWPYPIGQFILVPKSVQTVDIKDSFWVADTTTAFAKQMPGGMTALVPGEDGSILTSDYNLAHTQWSVQYRIVDAAQNVRTMATALIPRIVRKAVERGVVLAAAETTLDDVIQAPDQMRSRVRQYAQQYLDRLNGGIVISQITLMQAVPPRPVLEDYERVNQASVSAAQQRVQAGQTASQNLNQMAGPAFEELGKLIGEYDRLLAQAQADPSLNDLADAKLEEINEVLVSTRVGGTVAMAIGRATSARGAITAAYRSDVERFRAWRERYEENPELTTFVLWASTMRRVMQKNLEWFGLPANTWQIDMLINPDPERRRAIERQRN